MAIQLRPRSDKRPARVVAPHLIEPRSRLLRRLPTPDERRRVVFRRRRRRLMAVVVLLVLSPWIYSYASTMTQPSSLPLSIRTIEWLRGNGFAWLVNGVEHYYYEWTAPSKGGPGLRSLPSVGGTTVTTASGAVVVRPRQRYLPPAISPVLGPALPGEGVWKPAGPVSAGGASVYVTDYRPDPAYPRMVAYVAWIDHTRTQMALYPGRYQPPQAPVRGPMMVPFSQRHRLLATFNSGFTHADSNGGFVINGRVYEPLIAGQATLLASRSGAVDVRTWHGGLSPPASIILARQNLPLIVVNGHLGANLNDGPAWGATLGNAILVWRSGVGIDRHGNLIYAAANYQTVTTLARILIHAGAVRAMQLDINAEWPTFTTYNGWGAASPVKLVPNSQQTPRRYLTPDDRDFFAVYAAAPGVVGVPLR